MKLKAFKSQVILEKEFKMQDITVVVTVLFPCTSRRAKEK